LINTSILVHHCRCHIHCSTMQRICK